MKVSKQQLQYCEQYTYSTGTVLNRHRQVDGVVTTTAHTLKELAVCYSYNHKAQRVDKPAESTKDQKQKQKRQRSPHQKALLQMLTISKALKTNSTTIQRKYLTPSSLKQ